MGVEFIQAQGDKIEQLNHLGFDFREGLSYPAYVEEQCPALPDWKALIECKELFSSPETLPKGRVIGYPQSWQIVHDELHVDAYLGDDYQFIRAGSEGNMAAEIKSAFLGKQPLLIFFWTPM